MKDYEKTLPKVTIITLNCNTSIDTIECIESIQKNSYQNYDIVVVDNGSNENDIKKLKIRFGEQINIIENKENYGWGKAYNIGIKYAFEKFNPDYIFITDNDTICDQAFLKELIEVAEKNETSGILGGKIYYYHDRNKIWFTSAKISLWTGFIRFIGRDEYDKGQYNEITSVDSVGGCSMLIKKDVIEKLSLFDTRFFYADAEYEFCIRAKRAGFEILYVPKSIIWHKIGTSRRKIMDKVSDTFLIKMDPFGLKRHFMFYKEYTTKAQFISVVFFYFSLILPGKIIYTIQEYGFIKTLHYMKQIFSHIVSKK